MINIEEVIRERDFLNDCSGLMDVFRTIYVAKGNRKRMDKWCAGRLVSNIL